MRSDLRHTVFSAARFSDILRRSYRARPAISCFIAFAAQPGVSSPRCAPYYNTRPSKKCQAIFRFILQSFLLFFSGNADFFQPTPFVVILPKTLRFISVRLRHNAYSGSASSPSPLPAPQPARTDHLLQKSVILIDRKSPAFRKKEKNFFARCNKTPPPRVISMNSKHPLKIAEKQLDGG